MSRVDFYHLQNQTLENVLPKLLEKAYETGKKVKIKVGNEERVEFINTFLWTFNDQSFIPHGSRKDGFGEMQPIWLSAGDDNPNGATMLFLVDGAKIDLDSLKQLHVQNQNGEMVPLDVFLDAWDDSGSQMIACY